MSEPRTWYIAGSLAEEDTSKPFEGATLVVEKSAYDYAVKFSEFSFEMWEYVAKRLKEQRSKRFQLEEDYVKAIKALKKIQAHKFETFGWVRAQSIAEETLKDLGEL